MALENVFNGLFKPRDETHAFKEYDESNAEQEPKVLAHEAQLAKAVHNRERRRHQRRIISPETQIARLTQEREALRKSLIASDASFEDEAFLAQEDRYKELTKRLEDAEAIRAVWLGHERINNMFKIDPNSNSLNYHREKWLEVSNDKRKEREEKARLEQLREDR